MKELIKYIAQALVDNSDQVAVQEITTQQTLVLELRVAKKTGSAGRQSGIFVPLLNF